MKRMHVVSDSETNDDEDDDVSEPSAVKKIRRKQKFLPDYSRQ
jgi:hypothetical protein